LDVLEIMEEIESRSSFYLLDKFPRGGKEAKGAGARIRKDYKIKIS